MNSERAEKDSSSFRLYYIYWGPLGIHAEINYCRKTGHARSYFIRNLVTEIERRTISEDMSAEKMHYDSIWE
jgi:hypothetical protein